MLSLRLWNVAVLAGLGVFWLASEPRRERPIAVNPAMETVASLERELAQKPQDQDLVRNLARAYIDAHLPGFAAALLARPSTTATESAETLHVSARVQLELGHASAALELEKQVLGLCAKGQCSSFLQASAARRAQIFQQFVDQGIQDPLLYPEASNLALSTVMREARSIP
jgi:predicted Zn-dependent protease